MSSIRVNNMKFKLHPVYDLFGADKKGNVISIITKKQPVTNPGGTSIKIKTLDRNKFMYNKLVFIWECHRGEIPKNKTVVHISYINPNDKLNNLKLIDIAERNAYAAERWRNTAWECPDCGFQTTNNAKGHHKRACKFSVNPFTEEEKKNRNERNIKWNNERWICELCHNVYSKGYKSLHRQYCKNRKME